ncbi:MAG: pseudouridine synthase [Pseudomonadota bacterium]
MRAPFIYAPPPGAIDVRYVDDHYVVVEKPAGLLSVPGKAADHGDCVETRVQCQFADARIVHRLDLDTSGLMVMARTAQAHRRLSQQFERREVRKRYVARIWGRPMSPVGTNVQPLRCDWARRPRQMVDYANGKSAETRWHILASDARSSLIALYPRTGRSHQLRVHMAEIGHPILGDRFYADEAALAMSSRMLLHAASLAFSHPESGAEVIYESAVPFNVSGVTGV